MEFIKALLNTDKSKENIIITIVSGGNINSKIILSDNEIIYSNNDKINWEPIIQAIPKNKKSQLISLNDEKIYIEFLRKANNVVICGAGHISIPIIKMCKLLDLPVTVIDDRITFTDNAVRAGADNVICEAFEKALDRIEGDNGTYFIIVTRGHRYDQICLQKIIEKENAYIGMIGSRSRVRKVLDYIEEQGISREKLNKVYTPIGLSIGAETPAEIAVAIMAQVIEVKNKERGSGNYSEDILNAIMNENTRDIPKAQVTIVSRRGSAPREVGTKMIVLKDGTMIGTIGGGCVEANLRLAAFQSIENNKCQLIQADMTGSEAEDDGMVCGGIVEIYVEPLL
ncbi:MAG TPA: xanthine dehydrogenase [Clostridiales bacterium]|nr:xanthine dehydrogenase [Clostridiales bacterium]